MVSSGLLWLWLPLRMWLRLLWLRLYLSLRPLSLRCESTPPPKLNSYDSSDAIDDDDDDVDVAVDVSG
jgi:hypothetical protein